MRKTISELAGILAVLLVFSCQSTGNTAGKQTAASSPSVESKEAQILSDIYEQHESGIILTGAKSYTVVKGDTLTRIARQHYGTGDNPYYFPLIIAASKGSTEILNPDLIEVGMRLTIPSLQENLNNTEARGNLKSLLKSVADFYVDKTGIQSQEIYSGITRLYNAL
ncbi:MAG: LysM peptidoglycan-binding domain-containing protein [Treponema sp.]|jgi:LysM repeat protein|nr:LysM peptidoglycan-binding domain-containing protein [Treponema sp.]